MERLRAVCFVQFSRVLTSLQDRGTDYGANLVLASGIQSKHYVIMGPSASCMPQSLIRLIAPAALNLSLLPLLIHVGRDDLVDINYNERKTLHKFHEVCRALLFVPTHLPVFYRTP